MRECTKRALINGTEDAMSTQDVVETAVELAMLWREEVRKPSSSVTLISS
jgi:hypothetical protein